MRVLPPGRVYNITPYLKFHPGSVSEIMRGAGRDCTDLFNQVRGARGVVGSRRCGGWLLPQTASLQYHPYVQYDRFLAKCFVGNLIRDSLKSRKVSSPAYLSTPGLRQPRAPKAPSSTLSLPLPTTSHQSLPEEEEEDTFSGVTLNTPDSGVVLAGEWLSCFRVT